MNRTWKLRGDRVVWIIVVLFAMLSIAAVFSSSSFLASSRGISKIDIFFEQTKSVLLGFLALLVCYLCESIMFPTIFALAIKGVGRHTKQASSYLIMSIVGGAVAPLLMGMIADTTGDMRPAFTVPLLCYAVITAYAVWLSRKRIAG